MDKTRNRIRQKLDDAFGETNDHGHYNWLDQNHPQYVAIIENLVFDTDITPENLSNYLQFELSPHKEAFVLACAGTLRYFRRIYNVI